MVKNLKSGTPKNLKMLNRILLCLLGIALISPEALIGKASGKSTTLSVSGGITLNTGNKSSRIINGSSKFKTKAGAFEYVSSFELFHGKSGGDLISNKAKWKNNFSNALGRRINFFGTLGMEYDTIQGVSLRHNIGMGLQGVLSKSKAYNAKISASFNTESSEQESGMSLNSLRVEVAYTATHKFSSTAKLSMESSLTSNLKKVTEDFRIESTASISVLMKKPVWLKVKLVDKYTNAPIDSVKKKNDLSLVTALELAI